MAEEETSVPPPEAAPVVDASVSGGEEEDGKSPRSIATTTAESDAKTEPSNPFEVLGPRKRTVKRPADWEVAHLERRPKPKRSRPASKPARAAATGSSSPRSGDQPATSAPTSPARPVAAKAVPTPPPLPSQRSGSRAPAGSKTDPRVPKPPVSAPSQSSSAAGGASPAPPVKPKRPSGSHSRSRTSGGGGESARKSAGASASSADAKSNLGVTPTMPLMRESVWNSSLRQLGRMTSDQLVALAEWFAGGGGGAPPPALLESPPERLLDLFIVCAHATGDRTAAIEDSEIDHVRRDTRRGTLAEHLVRAATPYASPRWWRAGGVVPPSFGAGATPEEEVLSPELQASSFALWATVQRQQFPNISPLELRQFWEVIEPAISAPFVTLAKQEHAMLKFWESSSAASV